MKTIQLALLLLAVMALTDTGRVVSLAADKNDSKPDILYVGDVGDNTVKRFDANTGIFLDAATGAFVTSGSGGLLGPTDVTPAPGNKLLVNNNNTALVINGVPISGDALRFNGETGAFLKELIATSDPNAPFTPDGMIINDGILFIGNVVMVQPSGTTCPPTCPTGQVVAYNVNNGKFIDSFPGSPDIDPADFGPRSLVLGPDHKLWVTIRSTLTPLGGHILRYDPATRVLLGSFFDSGGGVGQLNRPDGLVFDPEGKKLYVNSFRADATDNDKIFIFDAASGLLLDHIDLDLVGQPRTFAQKLLFGPGGFLFVPIFTTGEVRSYDVTTKLFTSFVPPGGPLMLPSCLKFGHTNTATLAYGG